jgi:hypothetical protein
MIFDPNVWGPHYWFFLHTVAESYPISPNSVTKRKYYDLVQNFPLFIPIDEMGNKFSQLLDKYPVTPYLDTKESFVRWVHFIHNKLNYLTGKQEYSFRTSLDLYRDEYKPKPVYLSEKIHFRRQYIYTAIILICMLFILFYYDKM